MIEKFVSIKNIARFRDCSPRGDVTLRKLTLLFAEKSGKKSISSSSELDSPVPGGSRFWKMHGLLSAEVSVARSAGMR